MLLKGDYFNSCYVVFVGTRRRTKLFLFFCPVESVPIMPFGTEDSILAVKNVREDQQPVEVCKECSMSKCLVIKFVVHMIVVARQEHAFS